MNQKITSWIRQKVNEAGAQGCVFGISGGVDSAVVAALCKAAFPADVLGLVLPCQSNLQDAVDAKKVAEKFSIPIKTIDLEKSFDQLYLTLSGKPYDKKTMDLSIANLKPRLRMLTLYYYANKHNYLVVGTGNKSEAVMGYCTKYGDAGVDLLPLASLLKTQVRVLAKDLVVPQGIIDKAPSAGLWQGQTDEGEMGITYAELDKIIIALESNKLAGLDPKKVGLVKQKMAQNEHKRCLPPLFMI
ncbi:NAD(+) synthetase [Candidatus Saganbacteria bacterium CG08_land_8_20_14_0_20_45_16]|uniref:NH(3)-dependent NAD(+) synthetase n=1 Tax=Candidatus Saganbacteria bacterium CG08_land_8_20_14_0_20_45_16 TaxID=2014293 RepID=A0A2H0XZG6_UNCSA|nr:MAG: NAD(+) synthetase [Candidatus Saganbacteria bacterium CG08_land_8_20_14_0_20_45_16]